MAQVQVKSYKCFKCGEPIIFKNGFKNAKGKAQMFNVDGTIHKCDENKQKDYRNSDEYKQNNQSRDKARSARYWKFFWGYGTGANYKKYSSDEYKNRRKESRQKREEYKQQYYNESLNLDKALEILEIVKDNFMKLSRSEKFQTIKTAYRKMCLKFHPDRNKAQEASARFIECTQAYEHLESEYKIV